jgi:hypothetical protein
MASNEIKETKVSNKANKRNIYLADTYFNEKIEKANPQEQGRPQVQARPYAEGLQQQAPLDLPTEAIALCQEIEQEIVGGNFSRVKEFYKHCKQTYDCYGFVLEYAAFHGNMEHVKLALSKHADQIDVAFKVACKKNQLEIAKLLLSKIYEGYNRMTHQQIKYMFDLSFICAQEENHEGIQSFLSKQVDGEGNSWLFRQEQ